MKKLIPLLLLLTACRNHKAEIVEQLRTATLNLQSSQDVYSYDSVPGHLKFDEHALVQIGLDVHNLIYYKNEVDSLELELKKY